MLTAQRIAMILLAVVLCLAAALRRAQAAFDTQLLTATRGMLGVPDEWLRGASRLIVLNGARIQLASGRSQETLHALLDRAEADCRLRSAGLHVRAKRISDHVKRALPSLADGILRVENEREGLVACLDLGQSTISLDDLATRLAEFAKRGDLQALGGVRMLRAEARDQAAFFVSTWNEGRAPLWQMFPLTGDAPGVDFADVPRPLRSRRVLSTWQEHGAPALNVYESADAPDVLWERYTRELTRQGWLEASQDHAQSAAQRALLLVRGGHQLVITAEAQNGKTLLTVMPLDAGPGAAVISARSDLAR